MRPETGSVWQRLYCGGQPFESATPSMKNGFLLVLSHKENTLQNYLLYLPSAQSYDWYLQLVQEEVIEIY